MIKVYLVPWMTLTLQWPWPTMTVALQWPSPCNDRRPAMTLTRNDLDRQLPSPCNDLDLQWPWPAMTLTLQWPWPITTLILKRKEPYSSPSQKPVSGRLVKIEKKRQPTSRKIEINSEAGPTKWKFKHSFPAIFRKTPRNPKVVSDRENFPGRHF